MKKQNEFIWKAPADKRYENFVHTAADYEAVWLAGSPENQLCVEAAGGPALCVWQDEELAARFLQEQSVDAEAFEVELDAFLDQLEAMAEDTMLCVSPNGLDDANVDKMTLLRDMEKELELYE